MNREEFTQAAKKSAAESLIAMFWIAVVAGYFFGLILLAIWIPSPWHWGVVLLIFFSVLWCSHMAITAA